jgi:uncharacterized membrane protein
MKWMTKYHISPIQFLRSEINRLLALSVGFGIALIAVRILYTGNSFFLFLIWNLFLAFIPYYISWQLTRRGAWIENKWLFSCCFLCWLLFIPNTFYIITDMFHLYDKGDVPFWFDLILLMSFTWNALLMGILSVRHMEKIINAFWLYKRSWLFIYSIMLLNAFGVYIGRYLRFNSWDILTNPFKLVNDILQLILHPSHHAGAWVMTICFAGLLTLIYNTVKKIGKAIR